MDKDLEWYKERAEGATNACKYYQEEIAKLQKKLFDKVLSENKEGSTFSARDILSVANDLQEIINE